MTVTGANQVVSIEMAEALAGDVELMSDLVLVATNQALAKAKADADQKMQALTAGLPDSSWNAWNAWALNQIA